MSTNPIRLIVAEMRRRALSQSDLSKLVELSQGTVSRLLSGQINNPSDETKEAFFRALGVPVAAWPRTLRADTRRALRRAEKKANARRTPEAPLAATGS